MENVFLNECMFSVLPRIANKSVHLIFADLPYNETALKFDKGEIDLEKMWKEFKRILKPTGQVLFTTTTKFGVKLINSNPEWFRSDLVWEKTKGVGHLTCKYKTLRKHEMIYLFHYKRIYDGNKWTYNPQMVDGEPYSRKTTKNKSEVYGTGNYEKAFENLSGKRHPNSIVKIGNTCNAKNSIHPTQKPVELLEWLIKTYSNEGDLVLDPCAGSGSTILACINTGRKYIGAEINKEYYDKAMERIKI
jgi:site-specific DNA-methyltransferase (adenine-specific)